MAGPRFSLLQRRRREQPETFPRQDRPQLTTGRPGRSAPASRSRCRCLAGADEQPDAASSRSSPGQAPGRVARSRPLPPIPRLEDDPTISSNRPRRLPCRAPPGRASRSRQTGHAARRAALLPIATHRPILSAPSRPDVRTVDHQWRHQTPNPRSQWCNTFSPPGRGTLRVRRKMPTRSAVQRVGTGGSAWLAPRGKNCQPRKESASRRAQHGASRPRRGVARRGLGRESGKAPMARGWSDRHRRVRVPRMLAPARRPTSATPAMPRRDRA